MKTFIGLLSLIAKLVAGWILLGLVAILIGLFGWITVPVLLGLAAFAAIGFINRRRSSLWLAGLTVSGLMLVLGFVYGLSSYRF